MATTSQVKAALDDISQSIKTERQAFASAKARILAASSNLAAIPTVVSDVIATIDGYAPTGAFETLAKDERAKLGTEFTALKSEIDALIASF